MVQLTVSDDVTIPVQLCAELPCPRSGSPAARRARSPLRSLRVPDNVIGVPFTAMARAGVGDVVDALVTTKLFEPELERELGR